MQGATKQIPALAANVVVDSTYSRRVLEFAYLIARLSKALVLDVINCPSNAPPVMGYISQRAPKIPFFT